MGHDDKSVGVSIAVKLPHSSTEALALPFTEPLGMDSGATAGFQRVLRPTNERW